MSSERQTSEGNAAGNASILATLNKQETIGSDVNPRNGDQNPYGLDVAKATQGNITAGDLVVCDFNAASNIQGTGNSILALHPVVGSKPISVIGNPQFLTGCNAIAMSPLGDVWAVAFGSNDAPIVSGNGQVVTPLKNPVWHHPFGEAFVPPVNAHSVPAFYVSNAGDGSLVRIAITQSGFKFIVIATGFPVNGGVPGSILGPSGLNYVAANDRLYIVDGTNNTLYAINNVSRITANGIAVHGLTFSGPFASSAKVIFTGAPLNGPISSAILANGNIAVGNTLDPAGTNLIVEISPTGQFLAKKNVDTGAPGAIFGMVATGNSAATQRLYYNNDNDNTLRVLHQ